MSMLRNLWIRLAAVVTATLVAVFTPAYAWAAGSPAAAMAGELARRRVRFSGLVTIGGALCCLLVVAVVVLVIYLIVRAARGRGH